MAKNRENTITLVTDSHTVSDQVVLRQSETGQSLKVTLEHEDGTPYDLTNCLVTFSENKNDGKMVSDDNIQDISAKAGTFTYQFNQAVYQASGTAWFDITDNTRKLITTTVNFNIKIIDPIDLPITNTSYWSTAQSLLTHISANMSKWQDELDQAKFNAKSQLDDLIKHFQDSLAQYSALMNTYDDKFTSLQGSWQNQIDSLSKKTLEQAEADFKAKRDALENEFADFERQLKKDLSNKLLDVNEALTSISETNVPQVNESVNAVAKKVADLTNQLNDFDFSKYATHKELAALSVKIDSMYTNSKIDSMLSAVGTVKSVNGQKPDGSGDVLVAAGKVKTVNGKGPDNNGNISIGLGKVQSVNGNLPDQDGDVHVPTFAPNLLLGTQSKPKTVNMHNWSVEADNYLIDPSIDLSGQTVTATIKLTKSTNDAVCVLEYTDSEGVPHYPWGNVVPAGTTGYSTATQVLPANVKRIEVRPCWTNGIVTGTCTYSEAKLAVWKSASLPPDMTWVPNEADKANASDVYTKAEVNSKTSGRIATAYDIAGKKPTPVTDSYTNKWLVDQTALAPFADQINQLKGRRAAVAPDFNTLTDSGVYFISNTDKAKHTPPTSSWGVLAVFNGSSNGSQRITQMFFGDDGTSAFVRIYGLYGQSLWGSWNQIAWKSDISNLQSMKSDISNLQSMFNSINSTLSPFADQINQLKGRRTADAPDFNTLTDSGVYFISNTYKAKHTPPTQDWGTLAVFNGNSQRITQMFFGDTGQTAFVRVYGVYGGPAWGNWNQVAWKSDIETGYMKKPTVISQADYDKLATKDPNTLYEITE